KPLPIPRCGNASRSRARKSPRASNRRPRPLPPFTRPKSRNGGRSSRRRTSRENSLSQRRLQGASFVSIARRLFLQLTAGAAAFPAALGSETAEAYPSRPITMVVPFPPGGLADVIGRVLIDGMRAFLGQPVIIENVAGATGSIGTGRVARAAPDGYTIGLGIWNTHVANGAMYALSYDVVNDFEPIVLLADAPLLLVARKAVPANDLKEFI